MREILFRGIRTDNGEWAEGFYFRTNWYDIKTKKPINTHHWILPIGGQDSHKIFPKTVGQYTGLVDKNGKRIFEGDILRYKDTDDEYRFLLVEFSNGSFCVNEHGIICDPVSEVLCLGVEIIGNIHDNPELLEEA